MKIIKAMNMAEKWGIWEAELSGPSEGNPYEDIKVGAEFRWGAETFTASGFYDGNGVYKVRCMPDEAGEWSYSITSSDNPSEKIEGSFECTGAAADKHGPVMVAETFHFAYRDGTPYLPIGTTCYAWTHQPEALRRQTLETLGESPFNKMRMCVFPKHFDFNNNEPEVFPYEKTADGKFDFTRFNPAFFRLLEESVASLGELGVQADLILFHPYDHWGFSDMGKEADDLYVNYIIARLSAFDNVWWSLANEYDLMATSTKSKYGDDWERFAEIIQTNDPYDHLRSIHNCFAFYDHTRPWITHCSIQRQDLYKTSEYTDTWRKMYDKPVVIDECAYEGNISHGWGNITGEEMVRRFWEGAVRGGYVGHGETYYNKEEILWWSKGGVFAGKSVPRIAFLKKIMEEGPRLNPIPEMMSWDLPCGGRAGDYYLFYFGFGQPLFREFAMPEGAEYKIDIIDTWDMTVKKLPGKFSGEFTVDLPGKQYISVRMRKA